MFQRKHRKCATHCNTQWPGPRVPNVCEKYFRLCWEIVRLWLFILVSSSSSFLAKVRKEDNFNSPNADYLCGQQCGARDTSHTKHALCCVCDSVRMRQLHSIFVVVLPGAVCVCRVDSEVTAMLFRHTEFNAAVDARVRMCVCRRTCLH